MIIKCKIELSLAVLFPPELLPVGLTHTDPSGRRIVGITV
jgi:hypothetical protein